MCLDMVMAMTLSNNFSSCEITTDIKIQLHSYFAHE